MSTRSGKATQSPSRATSRLIRTVSGHTGDLHYAKIACMLRLHARSLSQTVSDHIPEKNYVTSGVLEQTYA